MSNCYLMKILPCVSAWNYQKIIANDHLDSPQGKLIRRLTTCKSGIQNGKSICYGCATQMMKQDLYTDLF